MSVARLALGIVLAPILVLSVYALDSARPEEAVLPLDPGRFLASEQSTLKRRLPDPDSAKFRDSHVSTLRPLPFACGEINVRGATGGYTGFVRFVSGATLRVVETAPGSAEMDRIWAAICDPEPRIVK